MIPNSRLHRRGGSARNTYTPGDAGPKSVLEGHHKLYCEQVIDTDTPLLVPDASAGTEALENLRGSLEELARDIEADIAERTDPPAQFTQRGIDPVF